MSVEEFRKDLHEAAQRNRISLDEDKLVALLKPEIDQGGWFRNIVNGPVSNKECLVITSVATHYVQGGLFKVKLKWSIRHKALDNVYYERGTFHDRVTDKVIFEVGSIREQFVFGMTEPGPSSKVTRDIAANNAQVAESEIKHAKLHDEIMTRELPPDPQVARFKRAIAEAEANQMPYTEASDEWTEQDYRQLWSWMFECWNQDRYQELWDRRIALGSGLQQREANNNLWYWINALPALAGLELKKKNDPSLAAFAAYADQVVNLENEDQRRSMQDLKRQFFG
jgi:hypothetical protein